MYEKRFQYLNTALYIAFFRCLIKEYNFADKEFIEYVHCHIETGMYFLPITGKGKLFFQKKCFPD